MKLKEMSKEELEALSYSDLTEMILKENKKAMNTPSIFKKICNLLELGEEEYANQIGDYYTSLTTDKRFILLDTAEWDLKDKHKVEIDLSADDEEDDYKELQKKYLKLRARYINQNDELIRLKLEMSKEGTNDTKGSK